MIFIIDSSVISLNFLNKFIILMKSSLSFIIKCDNFNTFKFSELKHSIELEKTGILSTFKLYNF